jgi:hypothetical protein
MWSLDELARLIAGDGAGELRRVERIRRKKTTEAADILDGTDLELLRLELSEGEIGFLCRGETDELELADIPDDWACPSIEDRTAQPPWRDLVNRPLFSVWQIHTAAGHPDGFQLEFGPAEDVRRIQVDGAASMIRCFEIEQIRA